MREFGYPPTASESNETAEAEKPISRRVFLKYIGALGGAAIIEQSASQEAEPKPGITTAADIEFRKSKYSKIDYTKHREPVPDEVSAMIQDIVSFQGDISPQASQAVNTVVEVEPTDSIKVDDGKQQVLYEKLRTLMPELGPYSVNNFFRALAYELPRKLAPYGIFTKSVIAPTMDVTNDRFDDVRMFLAFYKIDRTESDVVNYWGKQHDRDVVHLKGPLEMNGQPLEQKFVMDGGGQTYYENVILYDDAIAREAQNDEPDSDEYRAQLDEISRISYEEAWEVTARTENPEEMAFGIARAKLLSAMLENKETVQRHEALTKAHETGHLVAWQEENYKKTFQPKVHSKPSEYLVAMNNLAAHEEIDGFLGELRYGANPNKSLFLVLSATEADSSSDYLHQRALLWLQERFIEKAVSSPQDFGFKVDSSAGHQKAQILLQLPKLLERMAAFHSLVEEVQQYHVSHYNENLASEHVKQLFTKLNQDRSVAKPPGGPAYEVPWEKIGLSSLLVGGGALLLKKLHDRKVMMAAEKNRRKSSNTKKRRRK